MGSEQVAAVLRQSGSHVRIVVARPVESGNPDYQMLESQAPVVPSNILNDPEELNKYFMQHGYPEINSTPPRSANVLDDYTLYNGSNTNLNVSFSNYLEIKLQGIYRRFGILILVSIESASGRCRRCGIFTYSNDGYDTSRKPHQFTRN